MTKGAYSKHQKFKPKVAENLAGKQNDTSRHAWTEQKEILQEFR